MELVIIIFEGEGFLLLTEEVNIVLMSLGRNLRTARSRSDLTIDEIRYNLGYSKDTIYRIENFPQLYPLFRIIQYAHALEKSVSELSNCKTEPLAYSKVLIIDANRDKWSLYRSVFNQHFPRHYLDLRQSIDHAYGAFKEDEFNLIAIRHTWRNSIDDLLALLTQSKNSKTQVMLIARNNVREINQLARDKMMVFLDAEQGVDSAAKLFDDVLRYG